MMTQRPCFLAFILIAFAATTSLPLNAQSSVGSNSEFGIQAGSLYTGTASGTYPGTYTGNGSGYYGGYGYGNSAYGYPASGGYGYGNSGYGHPNGGGYGSGSGGYSMYGPYGYGTGNAYGTSSYNGSGYGNNSYGSSFTILFLAQACFTLLAVSEAKDDVSRQLSCVIQTGWQDVKSFSSLVGAFEERFDTEQNSVFARGSESPYMLLELYSIEYILAVRRSK